MNFVHVHFVLNFVKWQQKEKQTKNPTRSCYWATHLRNKVIWENYKRMGKNTSGTYI